MGGKASALIELCLSSGCPINDIRAISGKFLPEPGLLPLEKPREGPIVEWPVGVVNDGGHPGPRQGFDRGVARMTRISDRSGLIDSREAKIGNRALVE